jgi:type I restriction enzyme S subunit
MSEIKKLIERLCPDGVEYKKLGELCNIKGRIGFRGYTRQDLVDENDGAISLSPSNIINGNLKYEKCTYVSWDKYYESPEIMAQEGDIVFTKTASVGKTALIKTLPKETTINPQLVLLKDIKCNNAFLSYFLKGDYFQNEVRKITGIGSVPNVPQSSLAAIEIPVPPIEVQSKIVEYLDNFTLHLHWRYRDFKMINTGNMNMRNASTFLRSSNLFLHILHAIENIFCK